MTPTEIALFFRSGKPFEGTPHRDAKGNPFTTKPKRCDRCGGQGGSDAWKFTGWVCYKCNGRCFLADEVFKLYDADKLTKLNATADKRAAKKAAKLAADEAARKAEADARRAEFLALHGALIERAKAFTERNTFVKSVIERALDTATLTDKQVNALTDAMDRIEADDANKAKSDWVGEIGKRMRNVAVTVERVASYERASFRSYSGAMETVWIVTMRDGDGNALVSKTPTFRAEAGEKLVIDATPKDHNEYNGERQTVVLRIKVHEAPKPDEVAA